MFFIVIQLWNKTIYWCAFFDVENVIHHFKHHPRIIAINDKRFETLFEFKFVKTEEATSEIKKVDLKKTTTGISIAMLKDNVDIKYRQFLS